jgi:Flp pilus assembly protein TadB
MRAASLVCGAVVLGIGLGLDPPHGVIERLACRHDAMSVRTAAQLRRAGLGLTATWWRGGQLALTGVLALVLLSLGVPALGSASIGLTATRLATTVVLRAARRRHRRDCAAVAAVVARAIAAELRRGVSMRDALLLAGVRDAGAHTLSGRILRSTAKRLDLGAAPPTALRRSVGLHLAGEPPPSELSAVLELIDLGGVAAGVMAHRLLALADRAEQAGQVRRQAQAATSEPRFVAVAVPAVGAGLAAVLATFDARAAGVLASPLGVAVCAAGLLVACLGVAAVFRITTLA